MDKTRSGGRRMVIEEVIAYMEEDLKIKLYVLHTLGLNETEFCKRDIEVTSKAIKFLKDKLKDTQALEKQMPKKVSNRKLLRDFHDKPYSIRGNCPVCGYIGIMSTQTDYCYCCGQRLDWEGEEGKL